MTRRASHVSLLAFASAISACGGITTSGGGAPDASRDRTIEPADAGPGPGTDARDEGRDEAASCDACDASDGGVTFSGCPSALPTIGDGCLAEGEVCEYGPSWWLACNQVVRCAKGVWQKDTLFGPAPCSELDAGGPCPATWAEASAIEAGTFCPAADCQYPEGYCECLSHCGGGGGIRASLMGRWACQPATTACPSPRPRVGTACSEPDAGFCDYAWPCGCGQDLECREGVWLGSSAPPCP